MTIIETGALLTVAGGLVHLVFCGALLAMLRLSHQPRRPSSPPPALPPAEVVLLGWQVPLPDCRGEPAA